MANVTTMTGDYEYSEWQLAGARVKARRLTRSQKNYLKTHIDGPQPIITSGTNIRFAMQLRNHGLLKLDRQYRPKVSTATLDGRLVIAVLLAEEADALMAAETS